jgi:nucleotidyltransferase/DNA polymerase involved in DNA repair
MRNLHACLWIPDFAAAVLLRGERNRRTPPVAVFTGAAPNCFVYAATEPARLGGVREGMPLAEAVARYGLARDSRLSGRSPQATQTSRQPLRDEVKGKGIKPYRLRPTAPVAIGAPAFPTPHSGEACDAAGALSRELTTTSDHSPTSSLQARERSPEAERQTQQELIEMALTVSPRVEDAAPGLLIVDLAGLPDPHGSANQLAHCAEKLGLPANVGVSANRFVAIAAARTQLGVTHIFPGQEAGFLSVLPLDTLPLDPREQEVFARWGLRAVGDLARLPEDSLVARFGTRGGQLSQLARGRQDAVMRPYEPPPALEEEADLDWQIVELEPLAFLLSGLLERLCVKLQGHSLAAAEIRVTLKLADGSRHERAVAMSHPLADPRTLLTLVRIDLAAHPPGDAVEGVTVAAQPAPRRLTQFSLFDPALPSPEKLAVTLARLTHLVGPGRVGAPAVPDTHRPGAFQVEAFQVAAGARACPSPGHVEAAPSLSLKDSELRLQAPNEHATTHYSQYALPASQSSLLKGGPVATQANVLAFPALEGEPVRPAVASEAASAERRDQRADLPRDPASLQAKVVVFASSFPGEGQVGSPVSIRSAARRAPAVSVHVPATSDNGSTDQPINRSTDFTRSTAPAFRCFRPSAPAEVLLRGNLPVFVDSFEVRGPVRARAGPWQVCGEWWAEGWHYEEWDVEVNARLYRICCELPARRWFVTGAYD